MKTVLNHCFDKLLVTDIRMGGKPTFNIDFLSLFLKNNFICLYLAALCLLLVPGLSPAAASRASSLVEVWRLLIVGAPLVVEHRLSGAWASGVAVPGLQSTDSAVVVPGLIYSLVSGIFPA